MKKFIKNSFNDYKINLIDKFADFESRTSRGEMIMFAIINAVIVFVTITAISILESLVVYKYEVSRLADAVYYIINIMLFIPILSIGVRRLHDINIRGSIYVATALPFMLKNYFAIPDIYLLPILYGLIIKTLIEKIHGCTSIKILFKLSKNIVLKHKKLFFTFVSIYMIWIAYICKKLQNLPIVLTFCKNIALWSKIKLLLSILNFCFNPSNILVLIFLILFFRRGTKGANRFGPAYRQ